MVFKKGDIVTCDFFVTWYLSLATDAPYVELDPGWRARVTHVTSREGKPVYSLQSLDYPRAPRGKFFNQDDLRLCPTTLLQET